MIAFLCSFAMTRAQGTPWPPATPNNGYNQYLEAAKIVDTPTWSNFYYRKSPSVPAGTSDLDVGRMEAKQASRILELLKLGNSLPVYNPFSKETEATLQPEYAYFRRIGRIAADIAAAYAADGRVADACDWLFETEKFACQLPVPTYIAVLMRDSVLNRQTQGAYKLLPKMTADQLKSELLLSREIADHPVDIEAVFKAEGREFDQFIQDVIADPSVLGLKDPVPDTSKMVDAVTALRNLTPKEKKVLERISKKIPDSVLKASGPGAYLKAAEAAGEQLSPGDKATFQKLIPLLRQMIEPGKVSPEAFAKTFDAATRAHAEKFIHVYCDYDDRDGEAAFAQPEKDWALPWKVVKGGDQNAMAIADGREARWAKVDLYCLQIIRVLQPLTGDLPWARMRSSQQLFREKSRLLVIHTEIYAYLAANHHLPDSLQAIGDPKDPLSGQPYEYKILSPKTYSLAAVGVPGRGRIDIDSKPVR